MPGIERKQRRAPTALGYAALISRRCGAEVGRSAGSPDDDAVSSPAKVRQCTEALAAPGTARDGLLVQRSVEPLERFPSEPSPVIRRLTGTAIQAASRQVRTAEYPVGREARGKGVFR